MQRRFLFLAIFAIALYGSLGAFSIALVRTAHAQLTGFAPGSYSHMALLLPLDSPDFARAADMVRQGFAAAASATAGAPYPTRVYATRADSDSILAAYENAVASGARVVVGPLTRDGVATLAVSGLVSVPTLALNTIDAGNALLPRELYFFGLSVEAEARQMARLAMRDGHTQAKIVSSGTPLAHRVKEAFASTWRALGGTISGEFFPFSGGSEMWSALRQELKGSESAVFLATESDQARLIRSYLDPGQPVYGTSLVNRSDLDPAAKFDLNGVRFVDMPWITLRDHPAVAIFSRPEVPVTSELERLYALGIDAYRLALEIMLLPNPGQVALDGVTGHLTLDDARQFQRELTPVQYSRGEIKPWPERRR